MTPPDPQFIFTVDALPNSFDTLGEVVPLHIEATNTGDKSFGMFVTVIRIPACMGVDFNTLDGALDQGLIDHFELLNNSSDLVLYWLEFKENETKEMDVNLVVRLTAQNCYKRPHSAYLYYDNTNKVWAQS